MMGTIPRAICGLLPLGAAAFFTGCGGATDPPPGPPPPPPPPPVASVAVAGPATVLAAGATLQLTATVKDAAGGTLAGRPIAWTSSAPTIATVDGQGLVLGVASGQTTITATSGGVAGTVSLMVRDTATLGTTLSGRIERVNLTLAAGTTYRATGDLVLIADSNLTIAGNLETDGRLTLYAGGSLEITGNIDAPGVAAAPILDAVGAAASPPADHVLAGGRVTIRGTLTGTGGLYIAGGGSGLGHLIMGPDAIVAPGPGTAGTSSNRDGGEGHPIEIGTFVAQDKATGALPAGTKVSGLTRVLIVQSHLIGSQGGLGYSLRRADGAVTGNRWVGTAGNGGVGGRLRITTGELEVRRSDVHSGFGGPAGGAILTGSDELRSGSGPGGEGESMVLETGATGRGGGITITATQVVATDLIQVGNGGPNGLMQVGGGNGVDGGAGGDLTFRVGVFGVPGDASAPFPVSPMAPSSRGGVALFRAANGGLGTATKPGGAGGSVTVSGTTPGTAAPLDVALVHHSANGGAGFDGCVLPFRAGTPGGAGGRQNILVPRIELAGSSFNGGNGGHGFQAAGDGGAPGTGPGGQIGVAGLPGRRCVRSNLGGSNVTGWVQATPPCSQPYPIHTNGFKIINETGEPFAVMVSSPHSGFSFYGGPPQYLAPVPPLLGPFAELFVASRLNPCSVAAPFTTVYRVTAVHPTGTLVFDIPVQIDP